MHVLEDDNEHTESIEDLAEVRRLQKRLSDLNTRFRKVLNLIQEADDKALSTPEKAPTLLHEIRDQTERLQSRKAKVVLSHPMSLEELSQAQAQSPDEPGKTATEKILPRVHADGRERESLRDNTTVSVGLSP